MQIILDVIIQIVGLFEYFDGRGVLVIFPNIDSDKHDDEIDLLSDFSLDV